MAFPRATITSFLFVLTLSCMLKSSICDVVKGSVSCMDCPRHHNLSGVVVAMKCEQVEQPVFATTEHDGTFEATLPATTCAARILGGRQKLCAFKKNMVSKIINKPHDSNSYTISTPLAFYTTCPSNIPSSPSDVKSGTAPTKFGSSKTFFDMPLPSGWGLAPSSYYMPAIPFLPIIGIP